MKLLHLICRNLLRNKVRSLLTALAVFILVAILTLIATILNFLQDSMTEKEKDIKLIITERSDADNFSQGYMEDIIRPDSQLNAQLREIPGFDPSVYSNWNFILFSLDKELKEKDTFFITVATEPETLLRVADGLEEFTGADEATRKMKHPPVSGIDNIGIIIGAERLKKLKKNVGDVFKAYVFDTNPDQRQEYQFEVVAVMPVASRWTMFSFMDREYFQRQLQAVKSPFQGKVDVGWLLVQSQDAATRVAGAIMKYHPQLKVETLAAAMNRFLEPFKDLLLGVKYVLVPAIYLVMTLIVANAISITVRERQLELAVLKVMGFQGSQILTLVLGEGLLLGGVAGALGAWGTYGLVNLVMGGVKFQIGFFPIFFVPKGALWWGPVAGASVALAGCAWPAWKARATKVVDVFSKVA
jgi:putative ABC transport system permease protein